jgi:DNA-directed RNA polymerase specialized sigma24 family protein
MEVADDAATKETYARIRAHVAEGHLERGVGLAVQVLGPEVHGFLCASMANEADADEVFSAVCLRLWRSLANFEWRCPCGRGPT